MTCWGAQTYKTEHPRFPSVTRERDLRGKRGLSEFHKKLRQELQGFFLSSKNVYLFRDTIFLRIEIKFYQNIFIRMKLPFRFARKPCRMRQG